jgi:hypothetical protein
MSIIKQCYSINVKYQKSILPEILHKTVITRIHGEKKIVTYGYLSCKYSAIKGMLTKFLLALDSRYCKI